MNKIEVDKLNKNGRVNTVKASKKNLEVVDGSKYKGCVAWRMYAGKGFACFEMCSTKQQEACNETQEKDRIGETKHSNKNIKK